MPYAADLNGTNGQVIAIRRVDSLVTESSTVKNVTDDQYALMKDNAIMWHWDVATSSFQQGLLPAPNANANPVGALDLAKYNAGLQIAQFTTQCLNQLTAGANPITVAGWTRYVLLAAKFDAGTLTADETTAIQTECTLRGKGETPAQLMAKVKANDAKYTKAQAAVNGMVTAAGVAVNNCTDTSQVATVLSNLKSQAQALMTQLMSGG
jgi:hypothetical protein